MNKTLFYFPLESVKSRYTKQLCEEWMPNSFKKFNWEIVVINGNTPADEDFNIGHVLDSVGRSTFSFSQIENFLVNFLNKNKVKDNDILFFQDFWTPGMEAIRYALDLHKINVKVYSMLHAQSIDEYDFTWEMKDWMRDFELGIDKLHTGIFVGSSIHREQLRNAGFKSKIHVMSLPISNQLNTSTQVKQNNVIFSSRLNLEKNPHFMIEVAKKFLEKNKDWTWTVTTSAKQFKSEDKLILKKLKLFSDQEKRFILRENLSKDEYYSLLKTSKIQFNSSLQDYVSWTMLEAISFNCLLVYPNFRSFPECVHSDMLYRIGDVESALDKLQQMILEKEDKYKGFFQSILDKSNLGRLFESYIMFNDIQKEFNVWHEEIYMKELLNDK